MPKITKRAVDALKPTSKDVWLWDSGDGALKGFGIRMKPSGAASYLIQYRNSEARTRRLVLGGVGTLAPDAARRLAADKLHAVAHGADPSGDRRAARKNMTVRELCEWYLKDAETRLKPGTLINERSRINCHIVPLIGNRSVTGLKLADVEKMQTDIAAGRTAKVRETGRGDHVTGGRGIAGRTVGMFHTVLEHARRHGVITTNPAANVRKFIGARRERSLSFDELARFGAAMRAELHERRAPAGIAAVRALALTGCRRMEICALPWAWFDGAARCIRFGDTKTGRQLRPLGAAAVDHIAGQPRLPGALWVFPAIRGGGHFIGIPRLMDDLTTRAELTGVSAHTLRHTFASVAAGMGYSELTIAGMLGHAARGVTQRYVHMPDAALLIAADAVSARIAACLDGDLP